MSTVSWLPSVVATKRPDEPSDIVNVPSSRLPCATPWTEPCHPPSWIVPLTWPSALAAAARDGEDVIEHTRKHPPLLSEEGATGTLAREVGKWTSLLANLVIASMAISAPHEALTDTDEPTGRPLGRTLRGGDGRPYFPYDHDWEERWT